MNGSRAERRRQERAKTIGTATFTAASGSDDESPHWKIPDRIYNSALALAMLALQSERYGNDNDYRQAVDDVLGWAMPWSRQNGAGEQPPPPTKTNL